MSSLIRMVSALPADIPTPPAGKETLFFNLSTGLFSAKDSAGVVRSIEGGGGGPGSDTTAIHDNVAGEIAAVANKATPVGADFLLIEHSAAGNAKKHVLISSLPGGTDTIATPFGAKFNDLGKFAVMNGKSSDNDEATKAKTRAPIAADGTITTVAYRTASADATTQMKIHIDGVVQATFTLSSISSLGGAETVSVAVTAGQYLELEYDAGTAPVESTWLILQELS